MTQKSFSIAAVIIILLFPPGLGIFNHYIGSRLLSLPYGLLGEDFPLESRMYLAKNYLGHTYYANIHSGFNKITYSTNEMGFRVPDVDFSKKLVLMAGDSILFGAGLNDWETVPYLLQKKVDLSAKLTFANTATPGKSIAHHLLTLKKFIALSKKKNFRIKYLMLFISFNDFEENIRLEKIQNRASKQNLPLKDRLTIRFPSLAVFYKTLRDQTIGAPVRNIFSSPFIKTKPRRYETIRKNEPDHTRRALSNSKIVEKNLHHFKEMVDLCESNGIVLVNVITAYGYNDIFYEKGFSEYLDEMLKGLKQKHILKLKDIYHSQPEIYPYISGRDKDFHHFSLKAGELITDKLANYLHNLETSRSSPNHSMH
jgi:hypothetical protein